MAGKRGVDGEPLAETPLTSDAAAALRLAVARSDGRPVGTFDVLAALVAVDAIGAWETVQLRTMFLAADGSGGVADEDPEKPFGSWEGVSLTGSATEALRTAAEIAERYGMQPLPPGVLALGLVWRPEAGAARTLLGETDVGHRELLGLIQDEVLDVRLEDLETALGEAAAVPATRDPADARTEDGFAAPGVSPPGSPEDLAEDRELSRLLDLPAAAPSLADHLARSERGEEPRLSSEEYAQALAGAASMLQALHDRGLVHQDVRPESLATDPETGGLMPRVATLTGDRAPRHDRYTAPERRAGEVGPSVDQYALGVVAREVFTARGAPPLTTPVRKVLRRATAAAPGDRFEDIRELGEALVASVDAEAPYGLSERLARMPAMRRSRFTPAALGFALALGSMVPDARESALGVPLTIGLTLVAVMVGLALPWFSVQIAGNLRAVIGRPNLKLFSRPAVQLVVWLLGTAYLFATGETPHPATAFLAVLVAYPLCALLAAPSPDAGRWLIQTVRRWDTRQTLSPKRHLAVTVGAPAAVVALLALPAAAQIVAPDPLRFPTRPLVDYRPLVTVAAFRASLGERDLDYVCEKLLSRKAAGPRDYCRTLMRFTAIVQDLDPATRSARSLFGGKGTLEGFVVQEIPTARNRRSWNLLTTAGHRHAGFMYTTGRGVDHLLVQVSRDAPTAEPGPFRSLWLYDVVAVGDSWRIAGFRACKVGGPGTGRQDALCAVRDGLSFARVRAIGARMRAAEARRR